MDNIHDKNNTSSSHSSSNINLKNIDNEKNTGQIKQMKTSKNFEVYFQNKDINKYFYLVMNLNGHHLKYYIKIEI